MPDRKGYPRVGENINLVVPGDAAPRNYGITNVDWATKEVTALFKYKAVVDVREFSFDELEDKWSNRFGCYRVEETR